MIVDDEDFGFLKRYKIHESRGYAKIYLLGKSVFVHRLIANPNKRREVDHINGNKLDNRKGNLRVCTRSFNARNRKINTNSSTGFKGVSKHKNGHTHNPFVAYFYKNGKFNTVGHYPTAREAAVAYDEAVKVAFGEYANTNKKLGLL